MYKGYLIDLDGTAYKGNKVIDSAKEVINDWIKKGINILFVTNNASKSNEQVAEKLVNMGYDVNSNMIYSSANAMHDYLQESSYKSAYIIGEKNLKDQVLSCGIVKSLDPDIVVVGYTNKVNYDMLSKACIYINNGSKLISTNPDRAIPSELGDIPGNGAITKLIEYSTNKKALYIGKPNDIIINYALKKLDLNSDDVCMIGDNYETDIMSGINSGIDTLFVNTGLSSKKEIMKKDILPTHIYEDLQDYISNL